MKGRITRYAVIAALLLFALGYYSFDKGFGRDDLRLYSYGDQEITISEDRARHILYGDEYGGGHRYGVGNPCKSEFPAEWSDLHILSTIKAIAANDNLGWEKAANGYYIAEDVRGDVKVRVVMGARRHEVITGYPVNLARNPCPARSLPAAANDY